MPLVGWFAALCSVVLLLPTTSAVVAGQPTADETSADETRALGPGDRPHGTSPPLQALPSVKVFVAASCAGCHDDQSETRLNFAELTDDLSDADVFRQWEAVFDRVQAGEMPPPSAPRPDTSMQQAAVDELEAALHQYSLQRQQQQGRTVARRLTKRELNYTLQDLLQIDPDVASAVPGETDAGSFDTVGAAQRISSIHVESYLQTADAALDAALQLSANPYQQVEFDFLNNPFMNAFHELPLDQGGSVTLPKEEGVALFVDADYLTRGTTFGFFAKSTGRYRITSRVGALQSDTPVTVKLIRRDKSGAATLLRAVDIPPDSPQTFVVETLLHPGDDFYLTMNTGESVQATYRALYAAGGAKGYKGPGILLMEQTAAGPLHETWPPPSTQQLLAGVALKQAAGGGGYQVMPTETTTAHLRTILQQLAPRAFRRPVDAAELQGLIDLAKHAGETQDNDKAASPTDHEAFLTSVRVPLKAMLSSPRFLMFREEPGPLDDYALATRLSYFLWRSLPDERLRQCAAAGRLSDPAVLREQTERLLNDPRSNRFVQDFVGQWLRIDKVNATTPDQKLYPEWDEMLDAVLPRETELFFGALVQQNLGVDQLIDADFTYANRRLAEHYGLPPLTGQQMRKIVLPPDSLRGGVLTQAAILKTTANGTATSPVVRGNFVLSNLLGTPPPPPPAAAGSIEPDTRGRTTIREVLAAHRDEESCQRCHRRIDPPGFALEAFDPIGQQRAWYTGMINGVPLKSRRVETNGQLEDGRTFADVSEFKMLLVDRTDDVARHLLSRLVVFATGAEIQFADRRVLDELTATCAQSGYGVRDLIHAAVQSRMFRHK